MRLYTREFTLAVNRQEEIRAAHLRRGRAPGLARLRGPADRRWGPLPRRLRRRRPVRVAPHEAPHAGHRGLAGQPPRHLRHRPARPPARDLAGPLPQRRPGPLPHPGRPARADHRHPDPHRHRRGVRRHDPALPHPRPPPHLRRGHRGHGPRPPRHAASSRPTPATRPATTPPTPSPKGATSRCGSRPATSPSRPADRGRDQRHARAHGHRPDGPGGARPPAGPTTPPSTSSCSSSA